MYTTTATEIQQNGNFSLGGEINTNDRKLNSSQ